MTFDILLWKVTVMQILNALGHLRLRRAWSRSSVVVNFHSLLGLRVYFHLEFVKFLEIIGVINFRTFPRRRTLDWKVIGRYWFGRFALLFQVFIDLVKMIDYFITANLVTWISGNRYSHIDLSFRYPIRSCLLFIFYTDSQIKFLALMPFPHLFMRLKGKLHI